MRCWRNFGVIVAVSLLGLTGLGRAAETKFPFGTELMLDVEPLYGSKRIPMIEIDDDGTATIDLWCASVHASATVGESSITIVATDQPQEAQCTPERQTGDQDLLTALSQVTNWRRDGEVIELVGPTTLRFREMTN
jgi:META domain